MLCCFVLSFGRFDWLRLLFVDVVVSVNFTVLIGCCCVCLLWVQVKLEFVLGVGGSGRHSDTGDRYILSLFRPYLFNQVTPAQTPWLDLAHVVQCLNKLDVGSHERVTLVSADERNIILVSYSELKRCLDSAFRDLSAPTAPF
eukprot:m.830153 g.830153  ORF g.830153 m.830153 type:complete len:143 (-) comp59452_c0_seq17:283-711(-)